jgi:ligand-binding sensor domain-containing protein
LTKIDEQGKFHIYTTADGLIGDEVMAMLQDPDGNLWLGQEKGLCRIASSTHEL